MEGRLVNATAAAGGPAERLGITPGLVVQEWGWDEDVDQSVREDIESAAGTELVDSEVGDVVDVVLLWWRDGDGDLVDALVDSLTDLVSGGPVWLLSPKVGRPGYVEPAEVAEAAPTAGLSTTSTVQVSKDWAATKLVPPRAPRTRR
jgi:Protein of unknown function (DUF3052)